VYSNNYFILWLLLACRFLQRSSEQEMSIKPQCKKWNLPWYNYLALTNVDFNNMLVGNFFLFLQKCWIRDLLESMGSSWWYLGMAWPEWWSRQVVVSSCSFCNFRSLIICAIPWGKNWKKSFIWYEFPFQQSSKKKIKTIVFKAGKNICHYVVWR
jgi:hypothetical protein